MEERHLDNDGDYASHQTYHEGTLCSDALRFEANARRNVTYCRGPYLPLSLRTQHRKYLSWVHHAAVEEERERVHRHRTAKRD